MDEDDILVYGMLLRDGVLSCERSRVYRDGDVGGGYGGRERLVDLDAGRRGRIEEHCRRVAAEVRRLKRKGVKV